ncbi:MULTISPECIES: hypothetical protein [Marinobacter]|uniref:hypothetical protein n=1 Tax=Marinobacter TaxID=2742 RepID=UPI0019263A95|nr:MULTISPECIES: hypothetical protein [unclassified Marinobacter]MBL3823903.1 hypothetical protein [Marinobacter sp. MC3]MBL3892059.1 hypothetical protein [Marinobacter sp. MW3]
MPNPERATTKVFKLLFLKALFCCMEWPARMFQGTPRGLEQADFHYLVNLGKPSQQMLRCTENHQTNGQIFII